MAFFYVTLLTSVIDGTQFINNLQTADKYYLISTKQVLTTYIKE
jgi:hypothetical protein